MTRFPIFYIFAFVACFGMIGVSLAPLLSKPITAIEAKAVGAGLVFDGSALFAISPADGFAVTHAPGPRGDQRGPRLASVSKLEPTAKYTKGARLGFGPKTSEVLGSGALIVRMTAKPFDNNPAAKVAVGIVRNGPIEWVSADVKGNSNVLEFAFPASNEPARALAIWPAVEGQGRGIEVQSITFFRGQNGVVQ